MQTKRDGWLTFARVAAGFVSQLLGLYVSAYFSLVTLGPFGEPVPHDGASGVLHLAAEAFFEPIHLIDRAIRPEMWDMRPWTPTGKPIGKQLTFEELVELGELLEKGATEAELQERAGEMVRKRNRRE